MLTANCLSQLASVISRIGAISKMPALLTRMSMPPALATVSATAASIEACLVTSSRTPKAPRPISAASALASSSSRSATTTRAPSSA